MNVEDRAYETLKKDMVERNVVGEDEFAEYLLGKFEWIKVQFAMMTFDADEFVPQTVIMNSDNKLQAILADSRNSKVVDLATLNWTTFPVGAGLHQAVWEFGDTYKQPFMTQMATAPTNMSTSNLIVYFHGLQNTFLQARRFFRYVPAAVKSLTL